jgi:hypothetical protein
MTGSSDKPDGVDNTKVNHLRRVGKAYAGYLIAVIVPMIVAAAWDLWHGYETVQTLPAEIAEGFLVYALYAFPVVVAVWILAKEYKVGENA